MGGMTLNDLENEMKTFKANAFLPDEQKLRQAGFFREKGKSGEYHFNSKTMVKNLHKALNDNDYDHYKLYEEELSKSGEGRVRLGRAKDRLDTTTAELMENMADAPDISKQVRTEERCQAE